MPLSRGGRPRKDGKKTGNTAEPVFTLRELGISKRLSVQAQKLASLSEREIQHYLAESKKSGFRLSIERFLGEKKPARCGVCPTCGQRVPGD
jgi:hypothetical protein